MFFKNLKNLFSSPSKKLDVFSPCDGEIVAQEDIPDEVFAEGHMGIGLGIMPNNNNVISPFKGKIIALFDTKHAYTIQDEKTGVSIFLHLGIDTVNIEKSKKAFTSSHKQGDNVLNCENLCDMNLDLINKEAKSSILILLVTNNNMEKRKIIFHKNSGSVLRGDILFSIVSK